MIGDTKEIISLTLVLRVTHRKKNVQHDQWRVHLEETS